MARITPEQFVQLSEPLEKVYTEIVDALLINMAQHFNSGNKLSTTAWEVKKLSELGQLNKESLQIIAKLTGQNETLIYNALEKAVILATADIEPELKKAVKDGKIMAAAYDNVIASESIKETLQAYMLQAKDNLNLVNTTMLESTLDLFKKVVANTAAIENKLNATQEILNTAAGKVVTGTASRRQALWQALEQVHKEGITGFYDRAGRKWSPEAYVNMDIRTTAHNTAIQSIRVRQADYGLDIFMVSSHSGARPLCYPYQNKYFTWGTQGGTFKDGEGKLHRYKPISSTSYGKPAGLFGINCGHYPITVIPGVSIQRPQKEQLKEKNTQTYVESQKQRTIERDVRYEKQKAAMLLAAGDKEGAKELEAGIRQKEQQYRQYCKKVGRTPRSDRLKVYGYDKKG